MNEWPIKRELAKSLPNGDYMVVTAGLHHVPGNERPYFSVTCLVWEKRGNHSGKSRYDAGRECDGGSAAHDEILCAFPELQPVVAMHLADDDGVPMHALANGWYFYSGGARRWEESHGEPWHNHEQLSDRERAARALNIPPEDLPEGMDKDAFTAFAESLRPRWAEQAAAARALLGSL